MFLNVCFARTRTFAVQKGMSALPPKATCAVQLSMSALCQKRTSKRGPQKDAVKRKTILTGTLDDNYAASVLRTPSALIARCSIN